jgi:hypothetical protein
MTNPFGSESDAYRFVLLTVGAFAAIAVASALGGPWVGVPVWGGVTVLAVLLYLRHGRARAASPSEVAHVGAPDERRVVVLALEPLSGEVVERVRSASADGHTRVLVVCPAPVTPLHHWLSDVDGARAEAAATLTTAIAALRAEGIEAEGEIGDEDPLRAVEDALRTFGADELVVAGRRGQQAVVTRTRARFALPVERVGAPL